MPTIELLGGKEVGPAKKRSAWRIAQKRTPCGCAIRGLAPLTHIHRALKRLGDQHLFGAGGFSPVPAGLSGAVLRGGQAMATSIKNGRRALSAWAKAAANASSVSTRTASSP